MKNVKAEIKWRKIRREVSVPDKLNLNKTAEYNPIDDFNPLDETLYSYNHNL